MNVSVLSAPSSSLLDLIPATTDKSMLADPSIFSRLTTGLDFTPCILTTMRVFDVFNCKYCIPIVSITCRAAGRHNHALKNINK